MTGADRDSIAAQFQADRTRLRSVAYRILGSLPDADDAVQDAWIRVSRSDTDAVDNLAGFFTTVVARVSLSMLQSRATRALDPGGSDRLREAVVADGRPTPEDEALLSDSVGPALMMILDTLTPHERLAFVLHDVFAVPFEEIAGILGKSADASRQLASRARRRVRGAELHHVDNEQRRKVVSAFLSASRNGDFAQLVDLLAPDVALRADAATVEMGGTACLRGARAVADTFSGRARAAQLAWIDGGPGAVWFVGRTPKVAFTFVVSADGRIGAIEMIADADTLAGMDIEPA